MNLFHLDRPKLRASRIRQAKTRTKARHDAARKKANTAYWNEFFARMSDVPLTRGDEKDARKERKRAKLAKKH